MVEPSTKNTEKSASEKLRVLSDLCGIALRLWSTRNSLKVKFDGPTYPHAGILAEFRGSHDEISGSVLAIAGVGGTRAA